MRFPVYGQPSTRPYAGGGEEDEHQRGHGEDAVQRNCNHWKMLFGQVGRGGAGGVG